MSKKTLREILDTPGIIDVEVTNNTVGYAGLLNYNFDAGETKNIASLGFSVDTFKAAVEQLHGVFDSNSPLFTAKAITVDSKSQSKPSASVEAVDPVSEEDKVPDNTGAPLTEEPKSEVKEEPKAGTKAAPKATSPKTAPKAEAKDGE